jgi:hypothetical protein
MYVLYIRHKINIDIERLFCYENFLSPFFIISIVLFLSCETTTQTDLEVLFETIDALEIALKVTDNFVLPVAFENEDITVTW